MDKGGHLLYLISYNEEYVGFVHLGSRGCEIDWLEDIFVLPEFQGKGIGTCAIKLIEDIVKEYSETLYIEAAARNMRAIRLYQKIGYTCLNTITIRKDFQPEKYETVSIERIMNMDFDVKQSIEQYVGFLFACKSALLNIGKPFMCALRARQPGLNVKTCT